MNPIIYNQTLLNWTNNSSNVIAWTNSSSTVIGWLNSETNPNNIRYADFVRLTTRNRYSPPFTIGQEYTILSLGTTDFTSIGASSNTVGVTFTATGAGSGTGVATQPQQYLFATTPSETQVIFNSVTTQSCYLNYYDGYQLYLYCNFDPASVGIEVGQYVVGNFIPVNTQIIGIRYDGDESLYYITLNYETTDSTVALLESVTFCASSTDIVNFNGLGQLVQIGAATRDIKSTANETSFTLIGIDTSMLSLVLGTDIKGSMIEAWHGFFDSTGALITTGGTGGLYKFFTGYINTFSITEQWMEEIRAYVGAVAVNASSIQIIMRNRVAGRYTNDASWQFFTPNDNSMARVAFISNINYQFGKNT